MKSFIRGILTVWIVILLIVFGLVSSMKSILIDMTDGIIKTELKTNIVNVIENYANESISDDVIQEIENEIEKNPNIKKVMNQYYDKIMDVLSSKESNIEIDVVSELEKLIDDSEEVLKDYGVTLTEEEKQELLSVVSSSEVNTIVNDSINEIKDNLSSEITMVIDIYSFITSMAFKVILVVLIVVALLLIALLHKDFYSWLFNFGIASVITGTLILAILSIITTQILDNLLAESNLTISTTPLNTYSYILIILGVISIIGKIVITKKVRKENA